jgi:hypothetical protein
MFTTQLEKNKNNLMKNRQVVYTGGPDGIQNSAAQLRKRSVV